MDQMVKATLASVGPNTIDVRNEAGDTLLILACQHGCEVWIVTPSQIILPYFLSKPSSHYQCSPELIVRGSILLATLIHRYLTKDMKK